MTDNFENVNHLVLNFYPEGYSIAVKLNEFPVFTSETILETAKISYEETSLLDYIENEELPPLLVEMIDSSPKLSQYKIWQNGCLILEIRDKINIISQDDTRKNSNSNKYCLTQKAAKDYPNHNSSSPPQPDAQEWIQGMKDYDNSIETTDSTKPTTSGSYFILLKPTNSSMLNDVLNLTGSNSWTVRDRLQLESQIVLHNSPPLFLEPDATKQPPEQSVLCLDSKISNIYTRHKKRLPHTKLMCANPIRIGFNNKNNTNGSNKHNRTTSTYQQQTTLDSLPPELTLQHFLATQRAKKKTFAAGHLARFHRFKKHSVGNLK